MNKNLKKEKNISKIGTWSVRPTENNNERISIFSIKANKDAQKNQSKKNLN